MKVETKRDAGTKTSLQTFGLHSESTPDKQQVQTFKVWLEEFAVTSLWLNEPGFLAKAILNSGYNKSIATGLNKKNILNLYRETPPQFYHTVCRILNTKGSEAAHLFKDDSKGTTEITEAMHREIQPNWLQVKYRSEKMKLSMMFQSYKGVVTKAIEKTPEGSVLVFPLCRKTKNFGFLCAGN